MPLILDCPSCQRKLRVPDNLFGQTVKCPTCGEMFTATGSAPTASENAPAAGEPFRPAAEGARAERRPSSYRDDDYDDDPEYGERRPRHRMDLAPHRGTLILVLGILSLVICGILGPIAWVMGNNDLREMRAGNMDRSGEDTTNAGRICGIIATVLIGISLIGIMCMFSFAALGAAGAGRGW